MLKLIHPKSHKRRLEETSDLRSVHAAIDFIEEQAEIEEGLAKGRPGGLDAGERRLLGLLHIWFWANAADFEGAKLDGGNAEIIEMAINLRKVLGRLDGADRREANKVAEAEH